MSRFGKVAARNKDGIAVRVDSEEFYKNDELVGVTKGRTIVRESDGEVICIGVKDFDKNKHSGTFKGRNHSTETKAIIGLENSIKQKGENNSQFGTKWMNKGGDNLKVSQDQINQKLSEGWVVGRKDDSNFKGVDQELIDKVISLHKEGCKNIEIVRMMGLSKTTVGKYLKIYRESNS